MYYPFNILQNFCLGFDFVKIFLHAYNEKDQPVNSLFLYYTFLISFLFKDCILQIHLNSHHMATILHSFIHSFTVKIFVENPL